MVYLFFFFSCFSFFFSFMFSLGFLRSSLLPLSLSPMTASPFCLVAGLSPYFISRNQVCSNIPMPTALSNDGCTEDSKRKQKEKQIIDLKES